MTSKLSILGCALALCACASSSPEVRGSSGDSPGTGTETTGFTVDPKWPKPLPNNWILGQVSGISVDADDHVWLLQRPGSLTEDEKGAALKPPQSKCCLPAPPVLEFELLDHARGIARRYHPEELEKGLARVVDELHAQFVRRGTSTVDS